MKYLLSIVSIAAFLAQPAGCAAELFAPGVISTPAFEFAPTFSPDGRTCYFLRFGAGMRYAAIFVSQRVGDRWQPAKQVSFSGEFPDGPPALAPDGQEMYFASRRPLPGDVRESDHWHIWRSQRSGDQWADPTPLPEPVLDKKASQIAPSVSASGTIYFCQRGKGWDIFRSKRTDGVYGKPEPVMVNGGADEVSGWISPDEKFLVFASSGRREAVGESDLFLQPNLARFEPDDASLLEAVNTNRDESYPRVSPDGKLYFTRDGDVYVIALAALTHAKEEWTARPPLAHGRIWPQSATVRGKVYVYGGRGGEKRVWQNAVEEYDPATRQWRRVADPPAEWKEAWIAARRDVLYLFRRSDRGVAKLDTAANEWRVLPGGKDSPILHGGPEHAMRVVSTGERVFAMHTGDAGAGAYTSWMEFDFVGNRWVERTAMPFPAVQLAAFQGRIYAFGGGLREDHVQMYDPAADRWVSRAPMRSGRLEAAVAVVGRKILLIGGHRVSGEPADPVDEYDPAADCWSESPRLRAHVWAATAASIQGRVLLMGGGNFRARPVAEVREYFPARER